MDNMNLSWAFGSPDLVQIITQYQQNTAFCPSTPFIYAINNIFESFNTNEMFEDEFMKDVR